MERLSTGGAGLDTLLPIALNGAYLALFILLAGLWLRRRVPGRTVPRPVGQAQGSRRRQPDTASRGSRPRPPIRCSFCGKSQSEVRKVIAGPSVFICDECVALSFKVLRLTLPMEPNDKLHPCDLAAALDRVVDGHRRAKSVLAVAGWRHVLSPFDRIPRGSGGWPRSDVLLAGGTTAIRRGLVRALAEALNVATISLDAAELLAAGDRDGGLAALFEELFQPNWGNDALPCCILFIDNMDLIGGSTAAGSFQRALVGILGGRRGPAWELWGGPPLDSSQALLVCGGNFAGLEHVWPTRGSIVPDDLEQFGLCRLLADRLPRIAVLDAIETSSRPET